jgi:hypothetical protein
MYTSAPPGGDSDEVDPFLPIEIEKRSMLSLPQGPNPPPLNVARCSEPCLLSAR